MALLPELLDRRPALLDRRATDDEVSFPILLAWRLWKANALGEFDP